MPGTDPTHDRFESDVLMAHSVARRDPGELPALAAALNNLGAYRNDLGRPKEAVAPLREAVGIWEQLPEPDRWEPELAGSLSNLARALRGVRQPADAYDAAADAISHFTRLAEDEPERYLPTLAAEVNELGMQVRQDGLLDESLHYARQAVAVYREVVMLDDRQRPLYARALTNLGLVLSDLGQGEEAVRQLEHAARIWRRAGGAGPARLELAQVLHNTALVHHVTGRLRAAVASLEEAVAIYDDHRYRALTGTNEPAPPPDAGYLVAEHRVVLAAYARYLREAGRLDDATAADQHLRRLA